MEDAKEKILAIRVRYDDALRDIAKYRTEVDLLKASENKLTEDYKKGKITREEYNVSLTENKIRVQEVNESIRVLQKEIQNNIKAEKEQEGSLKSLRASLSNLTAQYDAMSEAERNSASGQDLEIHINAITDKIKDAEEKTQRFYRNVGNYQEAFEKILSPLASELKSITTAYMDMAKEERQSAEGQALRQHIQDLREELNETARAGGEFQNELLRLVGIQNGFLGTITNTVGGMKTVSQAFTAGRAAVSAFSKQLLALLMNPVVAILAGIAAVIMLIVKAINSSEESTNRVKAILAPVNRLLSFLMSLLQKAVGYLLSYVEAWMKLYGWLAKMAERLPIVGGLIKKINDANREAIELEKEKAAIEKQARVNEVQNAKDALEVSKLRKMAKDRESATAKERLEAIKKANLLEEQASKRNVELAERRYQALKKESEWADNDAATNEELAKREADVYKARQEYYQKTMELAEQENSLRNEIATEEKERLNKQKEAAKQAAETAKEQRDKEIEAIRQAEDAMTALMKEGLDKQRKETKTSYDRQIEDLKRKLATEKNLTIKAKEAINKTIKLLEQNKAKDLQKLSDDEVAKEIEKQAKILEYRLSSVKAGSDEELALKLQQLELQKQAELKQAEELGIEKSLIEAKYRKQADDLVKKADEDMRKKQLDEVRLQFENKITEAQLQGQNYLQIQVEQRKAELDAIQRMEGESDAEFKNRQLQAKQNYVNAQQEFADHEVSIQEKKANAITTIMSGLMDLTELMGEKNKAAVALAKMLAIAEVAITQGVAIANAVKTATKSSATWVDMLAAIGTVITGVTAVMGTAMKSIKSAKLARGGMVSGPGSGTSDSIPADLSNGESVMTAAATSMFAPILSSFNMLGGGVPINVQASSSQAIGEDMLARAVAKGVMMAPAPVLSVEEYTSVANRVKYVENVTDV